MKSLKKYIVGLIIPIVVFVATFALAEKINLDSSASVIVNSIFKIDLDKSAIAFGRVRPGEWENLGEGSYYNQVTCQSNNDRIWYLRINVLNPLTGTGKGGTIDNSHFKYMAGWTNGTGTVESQYTFRDFDTVSTSVYTSSVEDAMANLIYIQFQYGLSVPENATADDYTTTVVYTMMESL